MKLGFGLTNAQFFATIIDDSIAGDNKTPDCCEKVFDHLVNSAFFTEMDHSLPDNHLAEIGDKETTKIEASFPPTNSDKTRRFGHFRI